MPYCKMAVEKVKLRYKWNRVVGDGQIFVKHCAALGNTLNKNFT
jgi:hypothetical protein